MLVEQLTDLGFVREDFVGCQETLEGFSEEKTGN